MPEKKIVVVWFSFPQNRSDIFGEGDHCAARFDLVSASWCIRSKDNSSVTSEKATFLMFHQNFLFLLRFIDDFNSVRFDSMCSLF